MNAKLPKHLVFQGRGLNHAGSGRAAGSQCYIDPGSGAVHELYCIELVQVGPHFGLGRVFNNPGMSTARVRVDHSTLNGAGPLTVGQVLLVGPLSPELAGPKALGAWPLQAAAGRPPGNGQKRGTIHTLHSGFGFIRPADGSPTAFFHYSQCQGGWVPHVGLAVRYIPIQEPRGPAATSVCLA